MIRQIAETETYTRDLVTEIALRSRYFRSHGTIEQLHVGGGTPTFMLKKQLIEIMERLDDAFELTDKDTRDYSIEIDPRVAKVIQGIQPRLPKLTRLDHEKIGRDRVQRPYRGAPDEPLPPVHS